MKILTVIFLYLLIVTNCNSNDDNLYKLIDLWISNPDQFIEYTKDSGNIIKQHVIFPYSKRFYSEFKKHVNNWFKDGYTIEQDTVQRVGIDNVHYEKKIKLKSRENEKIMVFFFNYERGKWRFFSWCKYDPDEVGSPVTNGDLNDPPYRKIILTPMTPEQKDSARKILENFQKK